MGWENCANKDECINGNRFGKGCVEDAVQSATGGKPWHECYCGIDSNGNPPNLRQADEIERLRTLLNNIPLMVEKWETAHIDPDGTIHRSGIGKQIADDIREALEGK